MQKKTGVLLVNLGTPESPEHKDVYRYLIEFLMDPRVIDKPWLQRQLLVRGAIVPARYKQSAHSYQAIWTDEGSPLKVFGMRVQQGLQHQLGSNFHVELGMRYQTPSIATALDRLMQENVQRLLIFPLFPQYASATTGSVHQKVMEIVSQWNVIPDMTFVNQYATHPNLISAFCAVAEPFLKQKYDHILFSFHGLPEGQILKADRSGTCLKSKDCCGQTCRVNQDCYSAQCFATAREIANSLKLNPNEMSIAFQSRLGKDPWLQPFTSDVIIRLAREGKKKLLVLCPAFVCDCLETIFEIGVEYNLDFKKAGGEQLDLVPGLNDHPQWIEALAGIIKERTNH